MISSTKKCDSDKLISNYEHEIKELRQTVEKYFQIFYMSPTAIGLLHEDGTFAEVNPSFTLVLGFTKEEAIGKTPKDLGIWVNIEDRGKILQLLLGSDKIQKIELPLYKKNRQVVHSQLLVHKVILQGQKCYIVAGQDINMQVAAKILQKKQEEALLISHNKLSTAAALANIGPWEYDVKKASFKFCEEFYALYGTTLAREGQFMGFDKYIREFMHPEDIGRFRGEKKLLSLPQQEHSLTPADIIHRIIRRDGAVRTILVRRRLMNDAQGNILKVYGTNQDITERIRVEEEQLKQAATIKNLAYYDSLTGLPNRNNLNEWLTGQVEQSKAGGARGTVLFVDLDQLKLVNDAYGHSFGDKIIITVSKRLVAVMQEKSFVARIGGDKFVTILQGQYTNEQVKVIAGKIIKTLGKKQEYLETSVHVTASIGIAYYPKDGDTFDEIIKNAENAMYKAKKNGRNCLMFYSKELQDEVYKKVRLIEGLRYAIERRELSLVYQPQIILPQKSVRGLEALLRWNSSEYGNVPPAVFIPLAEQAGFINSIGKWVLTEACSFASRLAQSGSGDVHVAVNVSARQVASDGFVETISSAVRVNNIQPKQLEIEITESLLMTSLESAICKLNKIKTMGFHVALDDFGTGYSSLTYLRKLPVEILKIDKSFIDMIETDVFSARMIGAIINMAKSINLTVVAEGVETEKQLEYLLKEGCSCVQGYLFSKPLEADEAYEFIQIYNKGL